MGQPVSLILARLQTTPQGCSCGYAIPAPPKHSDYYHAQHLLRIIFQTQRVRSRALRSNLPQYFERSNPESESDLDADMDTDMDYDAETIEDEDDGLDLQPLQREGPSEAHPIAMPIEASPSRQSQRQQQQQQQQHQCQQSLNARPVQRKAKIPKYVHSLIQNRAFRNPLTNMEVEGDPTFFVVLEPGHGGWWYEPWAMATRPDGVQGLNCQHNCNHVHQQHQASPDQEQSHQDPTTDPSREKAKPAEKTPEMIQNEKELRKERWRQGRIVNLEIEAQHELEWRRWQRSLQARKSSLTKGASEATRTIRFKLGKDISLLEQSERGLRLPKCAKNRTCDEKQKKNSCSDNTISQKSMNIDSVKSTGGRRRSDDVELGNIHQEQEQRHSQVNESSASESTRQQRQSGKAQARHRPTLKSVMPWWEPDPQPFKMPNTRLSPFAISTLPEPVAKHFGGASIYTRRSSSASVKQSEQEQEMGLKQENDLCSERDENSTGASNEEKDKMQREATLMNSNTNGCKWVPVQPGDRVAVMIGTSKDFLLFPSFQRLLFRHLSCEDFEDRAGRVGVIPCPVSTVIVEGRRAHDGGHRRSDSDRISEATPQSSEPATEQTQAAPNQSRSQMSNQRSPWLRWISGRASASTDIQSSATGVTPTTVTPTTTTREDTQRDTSSVSNSSIRVEPIRQQIRTSPDLDSQDLDEKSANENLNDSPREDHAKDGGGLKSGRDVPIELQGQSLRKIEKAEDKRRRWQLSKETFERENYDSSDYSYASSGEEEDEDIAMLHHNGIFGFSSSDSSGDDSYDEEDQDTIETRDNQGVRSVTCSWTMRDWIYLIFCCNRPRRNRSALIGRLRQETRRERRRRRRIERWRLHQRHLRQLQQEQESIAMLRYLPQRMQRVIGPGEMYRCCQMAEFCRFYLTILMAIMLMGAIVYGAIQAESSPKSVGRDGSNVQRHGQVHNSSSAIAPMVTGTNVIRNVNTGFGVDQANLGFLSRGVIKILGQEGQSANGEEVGNVGRRDLQKKKKKNKTKHHHRQRAVARVAEGDSVELLQEELEFLSRMARVSIQGKVTSKKISTWLKSTFERNSILAIEQPEDRLTQPLDRQNQLNRFRLHVTDGYHSDSSFISNGELTDGYSTNIKTRRPLRRAISLEDLRSIRHHLQESSLDNRLESKQATTLSHQSSEESNQHSFQLEDPLERPASSASLYHRRQRTNPGATELSVSFVPFKDQPLTMSPVKAEGFDHGDSGSLPTPDISPEELSESSEELVIIQGDFLEEVRSRRSTDWVMPSQIHYGSFPETGADTATIGDAMPNGEGIVGPLSWLTESPFIDALVNWIEGPDNTTQQKNQEKDKPNPWMDIPLQFIALLTYPEPDPKNGNKMTLTMVRETSFVRQRRKTLMMLTCYTLVVRYCSFDMFVVVLFASNCAMLFLMKNSGRMNVNMAKRAVRQRVGWAKQWAGSIFKKGGVGGVGGVGGNNVVSPGTNGSGIGNGQGSSSSPQQSSFTANSPTASDISRQMQSSPVAGDAASPTFAAENSPQLKRRGLFGKRKTVDSNSQHVASSASSQVYVASSAASTIRGKYAGSGDGASILSAMPTGATGATGSTAASQKKRFFRRNNTNNGGSTASNSTAIASSVSAPVPIPLKRNTPSTVQHTGASTSTARVTNTPLSSSPLAQSQSLSQLQFSPLKPFNSPLQSPNDGETDRVDSKWAGKSRSIASTPPPLIPGSHSAQQSKRSIQSQDSAPTSPMFSPGVPSSDHSTPNAQIACDSVAMPISASMPLMVSGLSQLLGRSCPTTAKDKTHFDRSHWEDNSSRELREDRNDEAQRVYENQEKEGAGFNSGTETEMISNEGKEGVRKNLTLDAVTSASAEAMEGV
ncbi:hypothetical protein BGX27_008293 [Mortierella sp. AM989]|nr:hypothetical protein BGX27_008293 [Mortierella sp. AM989]